jgi:hypothetical protein
VLGRRAIIDVPTAIIGLIALVVLTKIKPIGVFICGDGYGGADKGFQAQPFAKHARVLGCCGS